MYIDEGNFIKKIKHLKLLLLSATDKIGVHLIQFKPELSDFLLYQKNTYKNIYKKMESSFIKVKIYIY